MISRQYLQPEQLAQRWFKPSWPYGLDRWTHDGYLGEEIYSSSFFMMDAEMPQAGPPATSSDGSWLMPTTIEVSAMTPDNITAVTDILSRQDPWAVAAGMQTGMQPAIQAARSHQGHLPMLAATPAQLGPPRPGMTAGQARFEPHGLSSGSTPTPSESYHTYTGDGGSTRLRS